MSIVIIIVNNNNNNNKLFLLGKGFQTALTLTSVPLERSPCFHAWLQLPRCLLELQDRCSVSPFWFSTSLFCL